MTLAGDIIAQRYRIEAPLGEGGMGAVFRATHLELGRTVAVKLVRSEDPSEQALERFLREAKSAAEVRHRNVVDVLDFGREGEGERARPYLVMECLAGESLEARLKRPPPAAIDEVVEWIAGALSGLAAIHDAGIVHRDLKPANVFLARDADGIVPKVLDFGIARKAQEASALTHTMQTLGTPHYMSPEQVRSAKTVDLRTDLYSVGVMLYLAFTGKLPFDGPSATAVIAAIVTDDAAPVTELRPDLPPALAAVVHKAMERDPKRRFADARSMRQALLDARHGIAPGSSVDRPSFTDAPTELSQPSGMASRPGAGTGAATLPRARTGRRAFFAMLGVLSTLLVAGLAGSLVLRSGAPEAASMEAPPRTLDVAPTPTATATATGGASSGAAIAPGAAAAVPRGSALADDERTRGDEALAGPGSLAAIVLLARTLPAADLASVTVSVDAGEAWLLGPAALDGRIDTDATRPPPTPRERWSIGRMETTVRANVRGGPSEDGELLATTPISTVVMTLAPIPGTSEANVAESDGDGASFTRAVVADGLEGFIATSLLRAQSGCLPEGVAPSVWLSRADVRSGGATRPAFLFFDPSGGGSLSVEAVDAACRTERLARFELPNGRIAETFLTSTARDGETLVAIGRWPTRAEVPRDGLMTWTVHRLERPTETVLELDLLSGQNLPDARRDGILGPVTEDDVFYPLRVRSRRARTFYVWDGARLVPTELAPAGGPSERR